MKTNNGFTLIELIIAISFFLIVVLLSGTLFLNAQKVYHSTSDQNELLQNSRVCIDRMSREIRQATALITDISSTTPSHSIVFQDGHDTAHITYITYYLDGDDLYRKHSAYYFPATPANYVYIDSFDMFSVPPLELILEDRIVGEYFENINFIKNEGLLDVNLELSSGQNQITIDSKIFIRNW